MLLSKQQRYVLDVLQRLGCVRKNQLEALLKVRFFPPEKEVSPGLLDAMLRQFRCGNIEVRREGDVIFLPGRQPDERLLEAGGAYARLYQAQFAGSVVDVDEDVTATP